MNRRGFLGLLLSLPLVRSFKALPGAAVSIPLSLCDPLLLRDATLARPWQIVEQTFTFLPPDQIRTVSRYVAHDQQWTYELMLQQDGERKPHWIQEIRKHPRHRGGVV